jgi:phage regulator Rha-like protein
MLELIVENKNGVLVVDSRLIAEELGIEHKTLMDNINTHVSKIESAFGAVSVEPLELKTTQGNTTSKRVAFLTEDQATFVMTLSRNTDKVIDAKIRLVTAFSKAKQALQSINPELLSMFSEMNSRMKLLSERTEKLDSMEKATSNNRGIKGVIDTEVLELYPETLSYTVKEYLQMKGVDDRHLNTMRKRAVMFANQGKQINLPRKGNEYVFVGNDISYLDQALKTVLGLD